MKLNVPKKIEKDEMKPHIKLLPGAFHRRIISGYGEVWATFGPMPMAFLVLEKSGAIVKNQAYAAGPDNQTYVVKNLEPISVRSVRTFFVDTVHYPLPNALESQPKSLCGDLEPYLSPSHVPSVPAEQVLV